MINLILLSFNLTNTFTVGDTIEHVVCAFLYSYEIFWQSLTFVKLKLAL